MYVYSPHSPGTTRWHRPGFPPTPLFEWSQQFCPYTGHTIYSIGTGTNQKDKYTLSYFCSDQTWTDWREQGGRCWIGEKFRFNFGVQGWGIKFSDPWVRGGANLFFIHPSTFSQWVLSLRSTSSVQKNNHNSILNSFINIWYCFNTAVLA